MLITFGGGAKHIDHHRTVLDTTATPDTFIVVKIDRELIRKKIGNDDAFPVVILVN